MKPTSSHPGDDTASAKQSLRKTIRRRRGQIPPEVAREAARSAADYLIGLPERLDAGVIALYMAANGELDPSLAAAPFTERGACLVYPRVTPGEVMLTFHRVTDASELVPGPFGILEPAATNAAVAIDAIELFVVPGLAFDRHGRRLGWGRGHYDATLSHSPGAIRVGFAHHWQIVDAVPSNERDEPMDILITEAGVIRTGARGAPPSASPDSRTSS